MWCRIIAGIVVVISESPTVIPIIPVVIPLIMDLLNGNEIDMDIIIRRVNTTLKTDSEELSL